MRPLPKMPVAELDVLAAALRHLADALAASEADRQRLARHVLTLQEDERGRLARELHDELGQCLTALRVDAAWLARRSSDRPEQLAVIEGIAARCAQMQLDVRGLLARLQPFGGQAPAETETLGRLEDLLRGLAQAWQRAGATTLAVDLDCRVCDSCGRAIDSPADLCLARPLALALFRLTQEALTNVARHARATRARVQLGIDIARRRVEWEVIDDGIGLDEAAATPRGNGIAGMRERVWALGGALSLEPASPQSARPGLRVQARFSLEAVEASA